jgi:hypothetical protein
VGIVIWLIRVCFRVTEQDPPEARAILRALLRMDREGPLQSHDVNAA